MTDRSGLTSASDPRSRIQIFEGKEQSDSEYPSSNKSYVSEVSIAGSGRPDEWRGSLAAIN